jgi:3-oxoadipate enol-lactonase
MMPYYTSRGLKLHFEALGDGPPVLLVHGFTNYGLVWTPQAVALAYSGFRVLMPDLAGHGLSDAAEQETTVSELATDMVALLDTLGIDRIPVCGLSLGGMIAQQIAVDHPDRISAMLVANSRAENAGMRPAVEGWITEFEGQGGPLARLEKTYPILVNERFRSSPAGEAALALWRLVLSRVTGRSLANVARGMAKFDVAGTLPKLRIPTLVVSGTEDKLIPSDLSRRTAELVPGAAFEVIPGAGHISSMDSTVAFNHLLLRFLSEAKERGGLVG